MVSNLKRTEKSVSQFLDTMPQKYSMEEQIESWLKDIEWQYSLWECQKERPEGFGDKTFHGNCSPTIIFALLERYSSLNDTLILDPMVGSGTFIDVARAMGYRDDQILAHDIRPLRSDVLIWHQDAYKKRVKVTQRCVTPKFK